MSQKNIKDIKFYFIVAIILLFIVSGFVWLETNVQKHWDNYEQKVFVEYEVK